MQQFFLFQCVRQQIKRHLIWPSVIGVATGMIYILIFPLKSIYFHHSYHIWFDLYLFADVLIVEHRALHVVVDDAYFEGYHSLAGCVAHRETGCRCQTVVLVCSHNQRIGAKTFRTVYILGLWCGSQRLRS